MQINRETIERINLLLEYMWESEEAHYNESENPSEHHIFVTMQKLREEINPDEN